MSRAPQQQPPPEPPLEQQMAWSRTLREKLDGECVHEWEELYREDNCLSLADYRDLVIWQCQKLGCAKKERGDAWRPSGQAPEDTTRNYCGAYNAWSALRKMLQARSLIGQAQLVYRIIVQCAPKTVAAACGSNVQALEEAYLCVLREAAPWQIVKAVAETLQAEAADDAQP